MSPIFKATVLESVVAKVDQLVAWLEVAVAGLSVSEGNFSGANLEFLRGEYLEFNRLLREKISETGLPKLVELTGEDLQSASGGLPAGFASPGLGGSGRNLTDLKSPEIKDRLLKEDKPSFQSDNRSYQKLNRLPHKNRDEAKDSRRSLILDFLRGKDWTSIKDITEAIKGCSAKTIQRELADLVHHGVLKKKGDRRWSRYLLG